MSKRISRKLSFLVFALLAFAATAIAQAPAPVFKAGAARRDVTPREPAPMWGYGDRHDALSVGTHDPLYAEALVIQAGDRKLAIVGLDLGRSPAEATLQRIRQRIKSEAGVEHSFIAGSHTHHGPVLELTDEAGKGKGRFDAALRYYRELEDAIVAAIVEANSKLAPAKLATGSIQLEGFNRNRHTKQPVKPSDRDLAVMRFDDANGKPIAIVVNFTAHPTTIPATTLRFSADYVGAMKAEVEKATGARVIFMQGASGDQSVNAGPNRDYQAFGQALAKEVVKLATSLTPQEVTASSADLRGLRFKLAAPLDLRSAVVRGAYERALCLDRIANDLDEQVAGVRERVIVRLLDGLIALVGVCGFFSRPGSGRWKPGA